MPVNRKHLYRFPWSKTDNPGTWIEVTDECDLYCPGCFRQRLEGNRPLEVIKEEIIMCQKLTNCERIAVAGGEPLIYPDIIEVVDFIKMHKMKPILMTNGHKLTLDLVSELKKAGLTQFYFHVDSLQKRPGWEGKNESELNELRQYYADLVWEVGGIQCGYNITISRTNLDYIPDIIRWGKSNIHKVQNLTLIAIRAFLLTEGVEYAVGNKNIDLSTLKCSTPTPKDINITSDEMFEIIEKKVSDFRACAYLNGTTDTTTNKFLVILILGSKDKVYGNLGAKTAEIFQVFHHLMSGKYTSFVKIPGLSKSLFLLSVFDPEVRRALIAFLGASIRNPFRFFKKVFVQCINLVQPTEFIEGDKNFCDGCLNLMPYKGKLVHSCILDEYRIFGGPVRPLDAKS
jgi:hypothetical protein